MFTFIRTYELNANPQPISPCTHKELQGTILTHATAPAPAAEEDEEFPRCHPRGITHVDSRRHPSPDPRPEIDSPDSLVAMRRGHSVSQDDGLGVISFPELTER